MDRNRFMVFSADLRSPAKLVAESVKGDDDYIEHLSDSTENRSSSSEFDSFMNCSSEDAESFFCPPQPGVEPELGKRLRDDTPVAHQGVNAQRKEGEQEPSPKRPCADVNESSADVIKSSRLKKAQRLANRMTRKVISLQREMKVVQSELHLTQQENIRLREAHADEDNLLRTQVEALLAEKWKLVQENDNLSREKENFLQYIENHTLSSQEEEDDVDEGRGISTDEDDLMRIELESQLAEKRKLQQENITS